MWRGGGEEGSQRREAQREEVRIGMSYTTAGRGYCGIDRWWCKGHGEEIEREVGGRRQPQQNIYSNSRLVIYS